MGNLAHAPFKEDPTVLEDIVDLQLPFRRHAYALGTAYYGDNYVPASPYYQAQAGYGAAATGPASGSYGGSNASQHSPALSDESASQLTHTTRASPATISWLLANYETAEGVSLPRCTLYNHYLRHCAENRLDPVNAASFGKLIRSVFLGLRTRRLGTRGNSKYHYYGIRIKPDSPLNRVTDENLPMAMRQQPQSGPRKRTHDYNSSGHHSTTHMQPQQQHMGGQQAAPIPQPVAAYHQQAQPAQPQIPAATDPMAQFRHLLGNAMVPDVPGPQEDDLKSVLFELQLDGSLVKSFCEAYKEHCEEILNAVLSLQLNDVEHIWLRFWQVNISANGEPVYTNSAGFTRFQLHNLCIIPAVLDYIRTIDLQFYQALVGVLIRDVLQNIPSQLTQHIRNFAKQLDKWMETAMDGAPRELYSIKVKAVSSFAQMLRRYTSLNHLAQAARGVLNNPAQLSQMVADLERVNFRDIQDQADFVCQCDREKVDQLLHQFKSELQQHKQLDEWAMWLGQVVASCLDDGGQPYQWISAARNFLLKWSFYSSLIIRDLTLRSACSFGSFHLIRLLYDEYMFYLVEHRVAQATGQTALGILSQLGADIMQHHQGSQSDSMFTSDIGHLQPPQPQHPHVGAGHFIAAQAIEPTTPGSFVDVDPGQFLNTVSQPSYTEVPPAVPHPTAVTQIVEQQPQQQMSGNSDAAMPSMKSESKHERLTNGDDEQDSETPNAEDCDDDDDDDESTPEFRNE